VIASGTRPRIPKIRGLQGSGYITSDEALRLRRQPKVLTIIGGGYIGCELAHFFGALGTKINIVQRDSVLIPSEDEEISKRLTQIFSKKYNVKLACE
jgi:mycothione reductase